MGWWERHVVPRLVEATCSGEAVDALRREACAPLGGAVLEIGFGSGLNLPCYPAAVTSVAAVEPSDVAWRLAQPRVRASPVPVTRAGLDGQRLTAADASVDAVLTTFTLCSVADQHAALAESRRVLRPGGLLVFLEHGLAPDERVRRWQRRLEPAQRRLAGGCHLTRQPLEDVRSAGFEVESWAAGYAPGPACGRPFAFVGRGVARKPAEGPA